MNRGRAHCVAMGILKAQEVEMVFVPFMIPEEMSLPQTTEY